MRFNFILERAIKLTKQWPNWSTLFSIRIDFFPFLLFFLKEYDPRELFSWQFNLKCLLFYSLKTLFCWFYQKTSAQGYDYNRWFAKMLSTDCNSWSWFMFRALLYSGVLYFSAGCKVLQIFNNLWRYKRFFPKSQKFSIFLADKLSCLFRRFAIFLTTDCTMWLNLLF